MMTAPERSLDTPAFRIVGHHPTFPSAQIDAIRRRIAHFIDHNLAGPSARRCARWGSATAEIS
jgi:hypothetical protein